jgi:hypothetical protein
VTFNVLRALIDRYHFADLIGKYEATATTESLEAGSRQFTQA